MSLVSDDVDSSSTSKSNTKYTVRSLSRATNKTKSTLPTSPRKKVAVLSKLAHGLSPKNKNLVFKATQRANSKLQCMKWLDSLTYPRQQLTKLLPFLKDLTCHIVNPIINRQ